MFEKAYLLAVIIFFILAFAVKNIQTYFATKKSIKGKSGKLTVSIVLSTCIYLIIISRTLFLKPHWIIELGVLEDSFFIVTGYILISLGFLIGMLALITMKNSWRVGIKHDQKTTLITNGIYRFSRNPYFFSYDLLILGYIFIFPSIVILGLYIALIFVFHRMILEEEQYLEKMHGIEYINYKEKAGRYFRII